MSLEPKSFSATPIDNDHDLSQPISLVRAVHRRNPKKRKRSNNFRDCRNVRPRIDQTQLTNNASSTSTPICIDLTNSIQSSTSSSSTQSNTQSPPRRFKKLTIVHRKFTNTIPTDPPSKPSTISPSFDDTLEDSAPASRLSIGPPRKPPPPHTHSNNKKEINTVEKAAVIPSHHDTKHPFDSNGMPHTIESCTMHNTHTNSGLHLHNQVIKDITKNGICANIKSKHKVCSKTVSRSTNKKKTHKYNEWDHNESFNRISTNGISKLNLIRNLNVKHNKESVIQFEDLTGDTSPSDMNPLSTRTISKEVTKKKKPKALQQRIRELEEENAQIRSIAKQLYTEAVEGEKPRWKKIDFFDTEHKVTRDSELAQLRTHISSLYPKGHVEVHAIDKWKGRRDVEESVTSYVKLNGEYSLEPYVLIGCQPVDLKHVIEKYLIEDHPRIRLLNGQQGVRALRFIPKGTCIGQYFGAEILQTEFAKVFDGTAEEYTHNIYAFDQRIDPLELLKVTKKQKEMAKRKVLNGGVMEKKVEVNSNKVFIIDPFIGEWKDDELLLRYVNDCRADIGHKTPQKCDHKFYNVEYVGMKVNGWPQTYLIAKRDIEQGEELMTYYGMDFSDAIRMEKEEQEMRRKRKERIDRDILQGFRL